MKSGGRTRRRPAKRKPDTYWQTNQRQGWPAHPQRSPESSEQTLPLGSGRRQPCCTWILCFQPPSCQKRTFCSVSCRWVFAWPWEACALPDPQHPVQVWHTGGACNHFLLRPAQTWGAPQGEPQNVGGWGMPREVEWQGQNPRRGRSRPCAMGEHQEDPLGGRVCARKVSQPGALGR